MWTSRSILKSSLLSRTAREKKTFWEHVPGRTNMVTLELRSKRTIFSKWLLGPNHDAHKICIAILSRTTVSILKYLLPGSQNRRKTFKYSFPAWMPTWISRWRRRRRRADNFPIWPDPISNCTGVECVVWEFLTSLNLHIDEAWMSWFIGQFVNAHFSSQLSGSTRLHIQFA